MTQGLRVDLVVEANTEVEPQTLKSVVSECVHDQENINSVGPLWRIGAILTIRMMHQATLPTVLVKLQQRSSSQLR